MVTWVRPMVREDLPAVLAIEAEANPSPWRAHDFSTFLNSAVDAQHPGGQTRAWVYADPEVRGFLCAVGAADEVELQSIAVEKVRWSRGVGSALMTTLFAWAHEAHFQMLHLEVREGNARAIDFYQRWGFAVVGRRAKYYHDNREAALLMSLTLNILG
jgi:[ribosomal protein S18]-alanine N-acetyltransferase